MFHRVKDLCDTFLQMGVPGFDLAVYQNGRCVLRHMGGFSDREKQIPINGQERWYIYSCSKPITCTAALQLWEQGLFSLEDPLCRYMPEFADMMVGHQKAAQPILIRHLFEMTAGFSYDINTPSLRAFRQETNHRCPTREAMRYLAKEPLLFEPGSQWFYSLCHDVLAALVEVISGQSFEDYVQAHIFRPLGMTHSTFLLPAAEKEQLARLYACDETTGVIAPCGQDNPYILGSDYASGGAGCVSTVEDYMKFLEGLRLGLLLKPQTVLLMATDRLTDVQRQNYEFAQTHGYGLGVRTPRTGSVCTDFGWGGAAGAYLAVDLPHGISLYYAQHVLTAPNRELRLKLLDAVLADLA